MLISADSEVLNLSNEFKVASANLCKSQSAKSKFKASSAKLALHIRGSIARTAEYKGLDDMLTTLARGESAVKFVLPVALCNILGKKLSPAVVNKVDFIKDDSGLWYLQLDENLLCGISKAVHKKFKGLERHVIGCELSGVVELDIIREFVSIHAANFCIFALSNLVKQGTIRDTAFVCSTYADSIKAEACSKELYKALNHIIFGYYQITTPSLFRGETLDTIVEIVDSQIDGGISY
jgi:hypothetical protein